MRKSIVPSTIDGQVEAPASKSYAQRAIAAATLADGQSELLGLTLCDDTQAAMRVATALGAELHRQGRQLRLRGGLAPRADQLDCGEAGLCIRMFTPIAALHAGTLQLTGHGTLTRRPVDFVEAPLRQLGAQVETCAGKLPITVRGPLVGGQAEVDGSISSQFLTGLLLALPMATNDTTLLVHDLKSIPYIDMTLEVVRAFGGVIEHQHHARFHIRGNQRYTARQFAIEGDWSGAAALLVAGAIAGRATIAGLRPDSRQADRAILDALFAAGAKITLDRQAVTVAAAPLHGFAFDATDCPDLFPPLVALAAYCQGQTTLRGARRLLHKESNRAAALAEEFAKLGVPITCDDDHLHIVGRQPTGGTIDSRGDHRIAMAAAVAALHAQAPIHIDNPDCVAKSYPGFYDDLATLGATVAT